MLRNMLRSDLRSILRNDLRSMKRSDIYDLRSSLRESSPCCVSEGLFFAGNPRCMRMRVRRDVRLSRVLHAAFRPYCAAPRQQRQGSRAAIACSSKAAANVRHCRCRTDTAGVRHGW